MNAQDRKEQLAWGGRLEVVDWLLSFFIAVVFVGSLLSGDYAMAIIFCVWGGLVRVRALLRAIRVDALIREGEEEARRNPVAQPPAPAPVPMDCPRCHISIPIPADYRHSNAKCPHCAHVFNVHG